VPLGKFRRDLPRHALAPHGECGNDQGNSKLRAEGPSIIAQQRSLMFQDLALSFLGEPIT
jgi:hypothetical protein